MVQGTIASGTCCVTLESKGNMCRWIAYHGKPITMDTLVTKPTRSLIEQSLNSQLSFRPDGSLVATNGDGFGMGWYSDKPEPGLFKVPSPAWNNENISELCAQISSGLFMAHIRAASVGAIQRTNVHPFKYKNWLFQHNGFIGDFDKIRRELQFDIAPELYSHLVGTTDSETIFLLALTYGLQDNPKAAFEKVIARVLRAFETIAVEPDMILSCAMSDGNSLYTLRYSSSERLHSQYYSDHAECLKDLSEENDIMPKRSIVVVSEPLDNTGELWQEVPANTFNNFIHGEARIEQLKLAA